MVYRVRLPQLGVSKAPQGMVVLGTRSFSRSETSARFRFYFYYFIATHLAPRGETVTLVRETDLSNQNTRRATALTLSFSEANGKLRGR